MTDKYAYLTEEHINRGKANYKSYLKSEIVILEKHIMACNDPEHLKHLHSELNRLRNRATKGVRIRDFGDCGYPIIK